MAGSIKFFQFVKKFHQIIGVHESQLDQNPHSNWIQTLCLICCAQFIFTTIAFLVLEVEFMFDYGHAFYTLISIVNSTSIYLVFIWQLENTLNYIKNCEGFIEKSEYPLPNT